MSNIPRIMPAAGSATSLAELPIKQLTMSELTARASLFVKTVFLEDQECASRFRPISPGSTSQSRVTELCTSSSCTPTRRSCLRHSVESPGPFGSPVECVSRSSDTSPAPSPAAGTPSNERRSRTRKVIFDESPHGSSPRSSPGASVLLESPERAGTPVVEGEVIEGKRLFEHLRLELEGVVEELYSISQAEAYSMVSPPEKGRIFVQFATGFRKYKFSATRAEFQKQIKENYGNGVSDDNLVAIKADYQIWIQMLEAVTSTLQWISLLEVRRAQYVVGEVYPQPYQAILRTLEKRKKSSWMKDLTTDSRGCGMEFKVLLLDAELYSTIMDLARRIKPLLQEHERGRCEKALSRIPSVDPEGMRAQLSPTGTYETSAVISQAKWVMECIAAQPGMMLLPSEERFALVRKS